MEKSIRALPELMYVPSREFCNLWDDLNAAINLCQNGLLDKEKCLEIQLIIAEKFKEYADKVYKFAKRKKELLR